MKNPVRPLIITALLGIIIGCSQTESLPTKLTETERNTLWNYYESSETLNRSAQICLIRQLTQAEVLAYTNDTMRREIIENSITFYYAPSQFWTVKFDANGKAVTAWVNGKTLTREEAEKDSSSAHNRN